MNSNRNFGSEIEKNLRSLESKWAEVLNSWQDGKASLFEENYLVLITQEGTQLLQTLEDLQELIQASEQSFPLE